MSLVVVIQPLSKQAFAPFGDVIECEDSDSFAINDGHTQRFHALSMLDCQGEGAALGISVFRNQCAHQIPFKIRMLERHPQGSQSFIPLERQAFIVVVALPLDEQRPDEQQVFAFASNGLQGVTYARGVWHHPLISLEAPSDFLVVDRIGGGDNCDVYQFEHSCQVEA
jgi:ureidoglycolate lyase